MAGWRGVSGLTRESVSGFGFVMLGPVPRIQQVNVGG